MNSIILTLAIKLYKKLLSFMVDYQSNIFGTGSLGDVYIGKTESEKPAGYSWWNPSPNNEYVLPNTVIPHFNNLIIGTSCSFTSNTPYLFLYVKDTLRIKIGARVHLDKKGDGSYSFSQFLPKPSAGSSTNQYTSACLKLFLSNRDVRTNLDLSVCGGVAPNGIALSGAGTSGGGGGLVCLYHKTGCFTGYDTNLGTSIDYGKDFVTANGGSSGSEGGGMLFVFAKNIVIEYNSETTEHGYISANGGDGLGIRSYIDQNPGGQADNPSGVINPQFGGGGVVQHVNLDVI